MQNDAVPACADGVAEADRPAVNIELIPVNFAERLFKTKNIFAEVFVLPGGQTGQNLSGKGLVDFPQIDIFQAQLVFLEERS